MAKGKLLILDISGWIAPSLLANDVQAGPANKDGVLVAGPNRFFARLFELLRLVQPSYLVVACDASRDSLARTELFPAYKANRPPKSEMFARQSKMIYGILKELQFPLQRIARWEADDVAASYAASYSEDVGSTVIASNDKDLHQILDLPRTSIVLPTCAQVTAQQAEERWKVSVPLIRQVQALAGDRADGIPGAPGIGPAKAAKLVQQYGSAAAAKKAADELTPGLKIAMSQFDATLNLRLVTLKRNLPVEELPLWNTPKQPHVRHVLASSGLSAPQI